MTDYLGLSQLAERVGISAVTAKSYMRDGRLPEPDATIGRVRGWLPETIDDWQQQRPGRGRRR
jgi:predicted DNA-binding transcriptional regulator AlpA